MTDHPAQISEDISTGYIERPCLLPRNPDGTLQFQTKTYGQTQHSYQAGGWPYLSDRGGGDEPTISIYPQSGVEDRWNVIVCYDDIKIANGCFTGPDALNAAFDAANTLHARFHDHHHRSGVGAHYTGFMQCKHLGTITEGDLEICDNCHRVVNGVQYVL